MASILILSNNLLLAEHWKALLSQEHAVFALNDSHHAQAFAAQQALSLLVIDGEILQNNAELLALKQLGLKILLIGRHWSEDRQIAILVSGIAGYCEYKTTTDSLLNAANSILQGDIWVQRHLVPKIIETLINLNNAKKSTQQYVAPAIPQASLQNLTHRELDVAKMIRTGDNNKMIATALNISERTVKAHLTSIFQKLQVQDRIHLALLLQELR